MESYKKEYYALAAKRFAASTIFYKVDSVVHVENVNDIWFWEQLLSKYSINKYKFIAASTNDKGTIVTGCTQCLKYKDFLSPQFFICIDSDLRYLLGNNLSANEYVLQTYTYSWENHCTFSQKLQQQYSKYIPQIKPFDFELFLQEYSKIVYKPFILMLYTEKHKSKVFNQNKFKQCISIQYKKGDEQNNGYNFLQRLYESLHNATKNITIPDFDMESIACESKGLNKLNTYLYVKGHCIYNSLISMGNKLCENSNINFEKDILKTTLAFDKYTEIKKIKSDIITILKNKK